MKYFWKKCFKQNKPLPLEDLLLIVNQFVNLKNTKIIKVVGTNGKGSTSNFIAEGLKEANYKVGLFTSPHLVLPNERIQVNVKMISDQEFKRIYKQIPYKKHFFISTFLVALKYFEQKKCSHIILEAGIGGKLDSTNAIKGDYGLVTNVALDHEEILGKKVENIAFQKAGIISSGMNFIIPSYLESKIFKIFKEQSLKEKAFTNIFTSKTKTYIEKNKSLASFALKKWFNIEKSDFQDLEGRSEELKNNNLKTYFDVAHNYQAVKESLKVIRDFDQVVICFKNNKDTSKITSLFSSKKLFYYKPSKEFKTFENLERIKNLKNFYFNQKTKTLYIGSFVLIGKIKEYENKK